MKGTSFCKAYTIFIVATLLLVGVTSWAGEGAMVIFDNPTYPYSFLIWGDDYGSGLTVAMALWNSTGEPTLDDAVEIFLPEPAMKFTPIPAMPDTIMLKGDEVPVAVYEDEEETVGDAYDAGDLTDLNLVAIGWVKGTWSGKSFKVITYSAIGTVDLEDGGEAQLVAVGHEYYKNGAFLRTNEKVDLY